MTESEIFDDIWYRPKNIDHTACKADTLRTSITHPPEQRADQYTPPKKPFNQRLFRIQRAIETLEDPDPNVLRHGYNIKIVLTALQEVFTLNQEQKHRGHLLQEIPNNEEKIKVA
jgi:hypothetical protein